MKVLLLSHGSFCKGLFDSYQMIAGKNENILTLSLDEDGVETFRNRLQDKLKSILDKEDVLIFTDIKGGTPFNEAYAMYLSNPNQIRVIAGMNLPILLETGLTLEGLDLQGAYTLALATGQQSIEGIEIEDGEEEIDF